MRAVFGPRPEDFSGIHDIFARHGVAGTIEEDEPPAMSAYVWQEDYSAVIPQLGKELLDFGALHVEAAEVPAEDWSESWKQFFKPREVGERFLIKPSWEDAEANERIIIELDPGQAFGTGEHPTTRMCLQLLEKTVRPGDVVIDIGCGSGVLAIAAAKLGARKVIASEIESEALFAARENAVRNGVEITFSDAPDPSCWVKEPNWHGADIVVSNIISATLIALSSAVVNLCNPGAAWILSGVIEDNWPDVLSAAEKHGFTLDAQEKEDGWIAALLRTRA